MKQTITAYKSILENKDLGTVFIASPLDEKVQYLNHENNNTVWVGELDVAVNNTAEILRKLFQEIKHGDQDDQDWLENKIEDFINFNGY